MEYEKRKSPGKAKNIGTESSSFSFCTKKSKISKKTCPLCLLYFQFIVQ